MKTTNRGPKLGIAGLIVLALFLGISLTFVGAVFSRVQARRAGSAEFEAFINYGTPIKVDSQTSFGTPTTLVITESRIEEPIFSTRNPVSRVRVWTYEWKYATKEVWSDLTRLFRAKEERTTNTLPGTP